MKHRVVGRKLGRTSAHRLALLRNLSTALFDKEKITTTLTKAKELRPFAEKLVTLSKRETLHARRQVLRHIHDRRVVGKLFDILSARYAQRPGGYTRILKLGPRRGDNAELAIIELVGAESAAAASSEDAASKKKKKGAADETAQKERAAKAAAKPARTKAKPASKKSTAKKAGKPAGKAAGKPDEKADKRAKSKAKAKPKPKTEK